MSEVLKFIQIGDVHLGGRVLPRCFSVTSEMRLAREEEIMRGLESLIDVFNEEGAEVLLVAGDLFDNDAVSTDCVNRVFDIFRELPFTCILPGNHDYLSGASPYYEYERDRRGLNPIPDNIHIFRGRSYSSFYLPGRGDVAITGAPFTGNSTISEHLMAQQIPRDPALISILLHHGARTQFVFEERMKITAPFTASELLAQNFTYTALGHYHSYSVIENAEGVIKAAYAGRPFSCEFRARNGCILVGTVSSSGIEALVQYDLDTRKIFDLAVSCENVSDNSELTVLAREECQRHNVITDDILRLRFQGTKKSDFKPEVYFTAAEQYAFSADFSGLHLGYDIEMLLAEAESKGATAESMFVSGIYKKLLQTADETEKAVLLDALDYGMKALRGIRSLPKEIIVNNKG